MDSSRTEELRKINIERHQKLCSKDLNLERLPPVTLQVIGNDGVFKHIFARQDELFALVRSNTRVRDLFERTVERSDWHPRNESRYHNSILDFLRYHRLASIPVQPRARHHRRNIRKSTADSAVPDRRRYHPHLHREANRRNIRSPPRGHVAFPYSEYHHREVNRRHIRSPPRGPSAFTLAYEPRTNPGSTATYDEALECKANAAATSKAQSQKSPIEGDPDAMRKGFEQFTNECRRMRLANHGMIPQKWEPRAALNKCYINAHLELGKDPPWSLVEEAHIKGQNASSDAVGIRVGDTKQTKSEDALQALPPLDIALVGGITKHAEPATHPALLSSSTSTGTGDAAAGGSRKQ